MSQTTNIRVALVEDDERVRGSLIMLIGGTPGYELVGSFPDAESALLELPQLQPDVVLMDVQLPKLSGIECVRLLKPKLPKTQIIILTVYQDEECVFDALGSGAVGFLRKDTAPAEILEAIRDAHAGGSPMSSGIARMVVAHFHSQSKPQAPPARPEVRLSPREDEILQLLVKGYRYKEIADAFSCSINTVREHLRRIYEKLQVSTSREAVAQYLQTGIGKRR
ncbi:MAG TPA: response regulator transcription factor [Methylomirabilota bacterium]|nr:response regulator transcription factor [Methylomirabilota bacterium]